MIVSLAAVPGDLAVARYGAWAAALCCLRAAWAAGSTPDPAELAGSLPPDERAEAFVDLAAEHLRLGWQHGRKILVEDLAGEATEELIEAEYLARHQVPFGDAPDPGEYRLRFRGANLAKLEARALGRWVKLRRRGMGAMGEVWEVYDRERRALAALKSPRREEAAHWRFACEAHALQALDHPSIPALLEFRSGAEPFLVMRWHAGPTLAERIADLGPQARLARPGLLDDLLAACDAVAHAHARGVVHGDLKPGNIICGAAVVDWGLARFASDPPDAVIRGTPESMAPEQLDGRADERTDVFGLGATLYEILAGRPPRDWKGARPSNWQDEVRRSPFARPQGAPRALAAVCRRAMAREPGVRHGSVEALAADVRRAREGGVLRRWLGAAIAGIQSPVPCAARPPT